MTVVKSRPRVVSLSVDQEIERLETYVRRMEARYECDSAKAAQAVAKGRMKETAEVARWLGSYNVLTSLKGGPGHGGGVGSHTSDTKRSIKAAWTRLLPKR